MPQQFLNSPQVRSALQQVDSVGMPESVWTHSALDPSPPRAAGEDVVGGLPRERPAVIVQEHFGDRLLAQRRTGLLQVPLDPRHGQGRQGDPSGLAALARHTHRSRVQFEFLKPETHCLAHPEPRAIQHFHERAIPHAFRLGEVWRGEDSLHLIARQGLGEPLGKSQTRDRGQLSRHRRAVPLQELQERADRADPPPNGGWSLVTAQCNLEPVNRIRVNAVPVRPAERGEERARRREISGIGL